MPHWEELSRLDIPYNNLVLTGFVGVGKSTIGRYIAQRLDVELLDIDEEIELREVMSIGKIRELFGDSRLRSLEAELCRQAALMRRALIVVPGAAMLEERNYQILSQAGKLVVVTCTLGEALRRMHLNSEQRFRDHTIRHRMLSRMRREFAIVQQANLLQLDTTQLSVEEESELLVNYWLTGETDSPHFRVGPPDPITPPAKPPVGISGRWVGRRN